jgi:hypothetical protein
MILEAPWVGRVPGHSTSEGWLRAEANYWHVLNALIPELRGLLGADRVVTEAFAQAMRWPAETIGQKLHHHHIDNGPIVAPVPAGFHDRRIHGKIRTWGRKKRRRR